MFKMVNAVNAKNDSVKGGKTAKSSILDLFKNNKEKYQTGKNNKLTAFSRLLQDKQRTSPKQSTLKMDSLQDLLAIIRKNLEKAPGAELSKANYNQVADKLLNQKITEQLKQLFKNNAVSEAELESQLGVFLEKLRNKDKLNKHDIRSLLAQIGNWIADGIRQDKKGIAQNQEKKGAELANIAGKESSKNAAHEPRIVVIDLRRQEQGAKAKNQENNHKQNSLQVKNTGKPEIEPENISSDVKLYTSPGAGSREAGNAENSKLFQNTLNRYQGLSSTDLQKMSEILKNEVVKNTGIVLKTNNNGEIRLILKPETLGKIKINLNLDNNRIDGKILVENNIVREIMETSLQDLNQALREQGYDAVSLQVSVNEGNKDPKEEMTPGRHKKEEAAEFEKNIPLVSAYNQDYNLVNLVI